METEEILQRLRDKCSEQDQNRAKDVHGPRRGHSSWDHGSVQNGKRIEGAPALALRTSMSPEEHSTSQSGDQG